MGRRRYRTCGVVVAILVLVAVGGATAATPVAADSADPAATTDTTNETVEVVFFHLPGCPHCATVEAFLEEHRSEYDFTVRKYNAREHPDRFAEYLGEYDVPRNRWGAVPAVFVGEAYAIGDKPAIELLEATFEESESAAGDEGTGKVDQLTLLSLAGLAATDAVNPCALAVLVILLTTILTREPENHRRVFTAGMAFALAVAVTYFAIGVLLVFGLKSVANAATVQIGGLRRAFGVLAIVLGLLNVKDGLSYGAGGFTMEVPERWRPSMQRYLTDPLWSRRSVVVGAALAGVGVSLFLLPCTAGPYVVAGGLLADVSWGSALLLLAAYNLVFVLPMLAITAVVAGGFATADAVGAWRESHIETLHLIAGVVLVALGVLLAAGVI